MSSDSLQRGTRAKKEAYILLLVQGQGKVRATELFGTFSKHFPGVAIRTFMNEYLPAMEYREEVVLHVNATGYFVYDPVVFEKEQREEGKQKEKGRN